MNEKQSALIVDDDEDLCFMLSEIFRSKHISVTIANNLYGAKEELNKISPSLIVLDNTLPDGKGSEFVAFLAEKCPTSKIFMITGDYENEEECILEGITRLIRKPFSLNKFRTIIETYLAPENKLN